MADDQEIKEFKPDHQIVVTDQMVAAGVKIMLNWMDSDEPDIRVPVRQLIPAALLERETSG